MVWEGVATRSVGGRNEKKFPEEADPINAREAVAIVTEAKIIKNEGPLLTLPSATSSREEVPPNRSWRADR